MTIPSRPAPAPPGASSQNAAAGANASLEQLRQQLAQQHRQQQQQNGGGVQRMTIKIPPPPKRPMQNGLQQQQQNYNGHNNNNNNNNNNSSSITRKFPQARYAPATNWDDSPFDAATATTTTTSSAASSTNGNFKKVPPPRPPPPKVQLNGAGARKTTAPAPPMQSANIRIANIFQRKKASSKVPTAQQNGASRIYGVSSGNYGSVSSATATVASHQNGTAASNSWNNANWNNGSSNVYAASSLASLSNPQTHSAVHEAQLISFDSPPSSPTFTQKSNSDCVSVDSFSSDSNFSSPNNGSVSQPESGFEDDFSRSRPPTTSPLDPWETIDAFGDSSAYGSSGSIIGTAPVRNFSTTNTRIQASNDNPLCNGKSLLPPAPSLAMPTIIKPKISQKPKAPKPPSTLIFNRQNPATAATTPLWNANLPTPPSPPMPMGAPPPPPSHAALSSSSSTSYGVAAGVGSGFSLLDVISGKVDAIHLGSSSAGTGGGVAYAEESRQSYGLALYDFNGVEEGDLCFRENEKIYLLEQVSAEWYRGRTRAGCEGIFPANYIDIRVPLVAASAATSSSAATTPTYQQQSGFTMQMQPQGTAASSSSSATQPRLRCLYNFATEVEGDLALKENEMVTVLYKINEDWLYGEVVDGRQGQFPANFLEYVPANLPMA